MSTEETKVKLGADTTELNTNLDASAWLTEKNMNQMAAAIERASAQSTAAVKSMQSQMSSHFDQIGGSIHKITGIFATLAGIAAGGSAFKEIIGKTNEWTGTAIKLSKQLGDTTENASILMQAAAGLGLSTDVVTGQIKGFVRQLKANEDGLNAMGIKTEDASGKTRSMIDIMLDANKVLLGYKEGKDRDIAMMTVYGRAAMENAKFLQINAAVMEEAKRRAEELGVVVGKEAVAQFKEFRKSQIDLKEVMHSIEIQIGNAVIPAFNQLGAWLSSTGPQAIQIFKGALNGVTTFVMYMGLGIITLYETIKAAFQQIVTIATTAGSILSKVLKGDFSGAVAAAKGGWGELMTTGETAFNNIAIAAEKTNDRVMKLWGLKPTKKAADEPEEKEGKQFKGGKKEEKEVSRVPEWKAELEEMKLAEDAFLASSKKDDLAYWEDKKKNMRMSAEESRAVNHEILVLKKEIQREDLQNDLEGIKLRISQETAGSKARVDIWDEGVKKIAAAYGRDSKEYKAALLEKEKLAREHAQLLIHLADSITETNREIATIGIEIDQANAAMQLQLGVITAEQELAITRRLEDRKAAIQVEALREKLARETEGTLEYQKILNQIEIAEAKHVAKIAEIDRKKVMEQNSTFNDVYAHMEKSFSTVIQGMLTSGMKLSQAMKQITRQMVNMFADMGVKILFDWIRKQVMMTLFHQGQEAVRTATTAEAETTRTAVTTAGAGVQIIANAASAAAGAASSQASIPYVGPILAAVAAASMLAMVLGFASNIKSAAGGWDRVSGNQMMQVHNDEMVLPAELAEGIRTNLGQGQQPIKQPSGGDTIHIKAVDAKSIEKLLKRNGGAVATSLAKQVRNFKGIKA